ncbi:MAG TPA: PaaI family thioesterase, partial [Candidatus Limnocylindrales bacterium]|nr:PaaI family thioesterase [Candidatus Limnocylindrales bacterium]
CGPKNDRGLRVKSVPQDDGSVATTWRAEPFHEAYPGALSGGVIGTLMDCHSNWTATYRLMNESGSDAPPCTVTADYAIKLRRPTPTDGDIVIVARAVEVSGDRAVVEAELTAGDKVCATSRGTFVAVKPGHPAYHRW